MYVPSFWFDIRIYLAVTAILLLVIAFYNPYAGILGIIVLAAMYKYAWERYVDRQKELFEYLNSLGSQVEKTTNDALHNLPLGIVVVDECGMVHWRNNMICHLFNAQINPGDFFQRFFPDSEPAQILSSLWDMKEEEQQLTLDRLSRIYHVTHAATSIKPAPSISSPGKNPPRDTKLMILYITDVTDIEHLRTESKNCRPVIAYIQIDNYDDALKGLTENQRAAILGKVNGHLADWVTEFEGFLKKFSDDTYIAVFNRSALDKMMSAENFDILDKVRSIHGGNKIPITLSMGLATGCSAISALSQSAQAGLELALGRGGDQAAVDINDKFQFYGGKSKAVEKNTRVRARIVAQTLRELIDQSDSAIIMGHAEEDFDSLGAAMGVTRMVRHAGKQVHIVVSKPGAAIDKLSELFLDYEEYLDTFISPAAAQTLINDRTLLFIVDTHRPELVAAPEILYKTERRVIIDHHRRAETFIEHSLLVYLEPSTSSTSELVTELLSYFSDKIELSQIEASTLYAGIVLDTKNFIMQTGVRTFEAASYLRRAGADPNLVRHMFKLDFDTLKHRAAVIANTETPLEGVAISFCPPVKNQLMVVGLSADAILNIEGMKVTFVLFKVDSEIGVSARSNGDINVQLIMEKLGGGGHQSAAGARVKDKSVDEVKNIIINSVSKYIQESEKKDESNSGTRS